MSFESGSCSFRAFFVPGGLPERNVSAFAKHAIPPIDTLGSTPIQGWVTGRHLLDRNIQEDTAYVAGYLRLTLVKAERKIPEALLRAECRIEELAKLQADGRQYLKSSERSEIRKDVVERLLSKMPPTLIGIPIVYDPNSKTLYADATSEKRTEALALALNRTTGSKLMAINPAFMASRRHKIDIVNLDPVSFSPQLEDPLAGNNIGQDFLTWLWFHAETKEGLLTVGSDTCGVLIEGPLTLFLEGDGAHVAVVRNGNPMLASETRSALLAGKKLHKANITLVRGSEQWSMGFDAREFVFRSFKVPQGEKLDGISRFQQRMLSLDRFMETFTAYFDEFIKIRASSDKWKVVQKDIHKWVSGRVAKR